MENFNLTAYLDLYDATLDAEREDFIEPEEDEFFEDDADYGYADNAPCDTYGMCAGTSCRFWHKCHGEM